MMNRFSEECKKFGENVSVRGVPRALKSKTIFLRIMWMVAVLVSAAILIWQLWTLFDKFYSYPHKISYGDSHFPNIFPSISICNLQPIISRVDYDKVLTSEEFRAKVDQIKSTITDDVFESIDRSYGAYEDLIKNMGNLYVNSLPKISSSDITIPLLTSYKLWDTSGEIIRNKACRFQNTTFWDTTYYKCYTFQIDSTCKEFVNKLTMIIFTHSLLDVQEHFEESYMNVEASGIKVLLSQPGIVEDISDGFNLGPGTDSAVKMDMVVKTRLGKPYNPAGCFHNKLLEGSKVDRYSYVSCVGACVQKAVIDKCDCVSSDCYLPRFMQDNNVCGNTTLTSRQSSLNESEKINHLLKAAYQMICQDQVTNQKLYDQCSNKCQQPCNETYYDVFIHSMGDWPQISYYVDFFTKFVQPYLNQSNIDAYFKPYEIAINRYRQNQIDVNTLNQFFKDSGLLKSNFLQVSFQFKEDNPSLIIDFPEYTWENMLSYIGGCFSLWLGITIMTAVEVLEFFINISLLLKDMIFNIKLTKLDLKMSA